VDIEWFCKLNDFDSCPADDHLSSVLLTPLHDCPSPIPTGLLLAQTRVRGSLFLHFKCQMQPCFAS